MVIIILIIIIIIIVFIFIIDIITINNIIVINTIISMCNFSHRLRSFKMPSCAAAASVGDEQGSSLSGAGVPFNYSPPQIVDVYLVSQASLSLMSSAGKK